MKTLKVEEIYCNQYRDLEDLGIHINDFIGNYYNRCRLHSALGYRSPQEFEMANQVTPEGFVGDAATMKYFRNPTIEPEQGTSAAE